MNICKLIWGLLFACAFPLYIGGRSKSSAQTTNNNTDKRLVTDGSSIGVSADNATVDITSTDLGAIAKSFDFATGASKGVSDSFKEVVSLVGEALDFSKETARLTSSAQSKATEQVSAAISTVQDNITGNKYLVTLGMIVAGVVGLAVFGKQIKL